ncbi:substrate-binding periplasmic protein [Ideonella sp. BN130291]|uniref:substrate-binding periplasmic protein n=1 Tax=Ideonella sp. BN130291 TaxID=3112940 RepID=UPI002E26CBDB|nr:transporter substrate-binding domain-containing protein [Ideonella sp. BN130291]
MTQPSLIACLLALTCLVPGAWARKLVLAATEYPPYYSETLPDGGPVTELTVMALRRAGYEVEVRFLPWARALRLGQQGEVDGLVGVWRSPDREAAFRFSHPVVSNRIVLCRKGHHGPARFTGFAALRPYTVGVVRGYADPPGLAAAQVRTEAVNDDLQNLRKLMVGHIDLVLIDSRVAQHLADRHLLGLASELDCLRPAVQEHPQYLAVSRRVADAASIVAAFNERLRGLRDSGEFEEIAARWGL